MFEYCLVVYMTMDDPVYKGNFVNCEVAQMYIDEYYPDAPYTVCLHQDYIVLPSNFIRKEVHYGRSSSK